MYKTLFDFQREDVDKFKAEGHTSGLFGYDMALGKTLTATTLTVELGTGINLIVAPQITYQGWSEAVESQTNGEHELRWIKNSSKAGKETLQDFYDKKPGWYFITWQLMRGGSIFETEADMVIADEVHEIQNAGTSNQNIMIKTIKSEYRIGLSGTAAGNKQEGLFGTLEWLWPKKYSSYWKWLKEHFLLTDGFAPKPIRERWAGKVTGDIPFYVRRLKDDHYGDMIPKPMPIKMVEVAMSPEQRAIYDQFEEKSGSWLDPDNEEAGFMYSPFSIVKTMRLREIALGTPYMDFDDNDNYRPFFKEGAVSSKMDRLEEIIQSKPGEPFVVYTHSKKFIPFAVDRLAKLGIKAVAFTGDLNYRKKRKAIDELGETYQVMIATQAAVGTGTDGLQHKASNLVWLSRDVKVATNTQARDRLYRPGQKNQIEQWEIVAINSHDIHTNEVLDYNEEVVNNMLDATRIKK